MTLAIIVPVYNEIKNIHRYLSKLSAYNFNELIIVDGGSQDGTQAILQQYNIAWIDGRKGRALQMNDGAAQCSSDILLFLHIDTQLPPQASDAIHAAMMDSNVVGGRFDVRLDDSALIFRLIESLINWRSRLSHISTGDQAIFVRKTVFEQLGGFPDRPLMEDIAFSHCLKRQGRIVCLREQVITSARRWQKHGVIRTILLMWQLRLLYWLGVETTVLAKMYHDAR